MLNKCNSLTFTEGDIVESFIKTYNKFVKDSKVVLDTCDLTIKELNDETSRNKEIKETKKDRRSYIKS